ncbi:MAG: hypothetical protein QOH00_3704, partial [Gaiellales bacterium]|nr:hypothetical protein [Gaiellales bacterium]
QASGRSVPATASMPAQVGVPRPVAAAPTTSAAYGTLESPSGPPRQSTGRHSAKSAASGAAGYGPRRRASAAAALARRLGSYPAAPLAALFALCLPVLWRGGPLGDSNVPYAALVVGAAAAGMGTPACAGMLAVAGTLRPEAWGLAVINAILGWRKATPVARALSLAAAVVPPALWIALDYVFTGDWWWSSDIVDAYNERFHPPLLHLSDLPSAVLERTGDVATWPVALLALAALIVGIKHRPSDAGVVFPLALILAVAVVVERGQISGDDVGRMLTALAVFGAAGAGVALAAHNAGILRSSLAVVAVAAVPLAAAPWLAGAVRDVRDQARQARALGTVVAPALEREAPSGYVALPRQWQGQLALSWDRPRTTFIPARAIGEEPYGKCQVGALIVPSNGKLPKWIREVVVTRDWRAGVRARPCTK